MFGIGRVVIGILCVGACGVLAGSFASASTLRSDPDFSLDKIALADIVSVDQLGYTCIREDDIDVAFHATGKGVRLPRTCLPEPCRAALTQVQLASLIGRTPRPVEWDDYFSRYADHCRKELVPLDESDAAEDIDDPSDFWEPLIASYPPDAPIRTALPANSGPRRQLMSFSTGGGSFGTGISTRKPHPSDPDDPSDTPDPGDEPDPISPVPLPGGLVLIMTGCAVLLRTRSSRAS